MPPGFGSRPMELMAHLGELRRRLIISGLAILFAACACFHFAPSLFVALQRPLLALPAQKMVVLSPLEMLLTYIKLALTGGLFVASPVVFWQLWQFVSPGLYAQEKRWVVPFVAVGTLSFVGGAAFCFYLVLPASFRYLVGMVPLTVEAHYSVSAYFALVTHLMLGFGAVFELPLVMAVLAAANFVQAADFARFRRYWLVVAVVLGGVLTPTPDPMTQMLMATPLVVFYELGIWGARMLERRGGAR